MTTSALLLLLALIGSCFAFTDIVGLTEENGADESNQNFLDKFMSGSFMPELCSPTSRLSSSSSASIHSLTPADITGLYTLGIPLSHRSEAFRIVRRLRELLSMFNPEVTLRDMAQTSSRSKSITEMAEELSLSLSHQMNDWKIVLLFLPADSICACPLDVVANVQTAVQEVVAAVQILQKQLHRTLVHVVVWSGPVQENECDCMKDEVKSPKLQRALVLKAIQDSLSQILHSPAWHFTGVDFAVVLQSSPIILESNLGLVAELNQLAVELWTNMIHPDPVEVMDNGVISIPCPTKEYPFLRTQVNTPTKGDLEFLSKASAPVDPVMGTEMPCMDDSSSPTTPVSVHELRPGDIKVVAAVGDSITAANGVGAKQDNLLLVMNQYRGLSWSIGGDENLTTVTTLPNILKEFNPSLVGFSKGIGNQDSAAAFLNVAVPGAKSSDMEQQVRVLVEKMKTDSRIDFQNDWKMITMFIGGNDICDFCTDSIRYSAQNVVSRISKALDILHAEVPRAIVNLAEMLNVVPLREVHQDKSLGCPTWFVNLLCSCVLKPIAGSAELQRLNDYNKAYQQAMRELVDSGRYDTHHNFTVVLQPFFREVSLPRLEDGRPDRSYFTPDCFHLGQKAHTLMARSLWNNLLEPVGNKTYKQEFASEINLLCPSESSPFIRTALNSNYKYPGPPPTSPPVTNWGSDFSCAHTAPSNSVPTSVHRLRPADIQVVAALGDSITAAFGARAKNILELPTEYRGVSWSIGGDETLETVTSLPNILKKFNPNIKGMSRGTGKEQTGLNMAVSGAKIAGIPDQVRSLVDAMKNHPDVDFENDWKLVTLFIGGNDLCQYCNDRASLSPKNYSFHMKTSLDILYNEVPRTIVNVLEILEIEGLRRIEKDSLGCNFIQDFVCPCFLLPSENSPELDEIKRINREFQAETQSLVYGGRYDGKQDFAVVLQPFFRNSIVPLNAEGVPDATYFSEDCFHFSERGHADMAAAIWNNMLEPVGAKQTYNNFTNSRNSLKCPTEEQPYIFTSENSVSSPTPTTAPTAPTAPTESSTAQPLNPECSGSIAGWLAAVLTVIGLLVGCAATWLSLHCVHKRKKARSAKRMDSTVIQNTYNS